MNINKMEDQLYTKVMLVGFFLIALIFGGWHLLKYIYYGFLGTFTQGKVVGTIRGAGVPGGGNRPTVEYVVAGTTYQFDWKIGGGYRNGDSVRVVYLKNNPGKAMVIGLWPLLIIALSLFFIWVLYTRFIQFLI